MAGYFAAKRLVYLYRSRGINGHALAVGELDDDGRDEIVAGFRSKGFQLYILKSEDEGDERWTRQILDADGIAAADC